MEYNTTPSHILQLATSAKMNVARARFIFGGGETIICHVVYRHNVFAMVHDIAHVCVVNLK